MRFHCVHCLVIPVYRELFFGCLLLLPIPGYSLSCTDLSDHFYISCVAGICNGEFRAREMHSGGACGRRVVVETVPDGSIGVLTNQLKDTTPIESMNGFFQVSLSHRFYRPLPSSADELAEAFGDPKSFRAPRIHMQKIEAGVDIQKIRRDWESRSNEELFRTVVYWVLELGSLLAALFFVYKTTAIYRKRVIAYFSRKASDLNVAMPLLSQLVLFVVVGMYIVVSVMGLFLIIFIVPIVLVVWIFEIVIYFMFRYKYRTEPTRIE